jgi:protein-S-isoprenylcysteine O-methyltransferase Ste14
MQILVFFFATLAFGYFTWRYAIVTPRRQGPYRFVVFEGVLALALMNAAVWFDSPARPVQILSWIALMLAILPAIAGFAALRGRGHPDGHFEATTELVTDGVYSWIRHPMYAALGLLAIGVYLKQPAYPPAVIVLAIVLVAVYLTAKAEEQDTLQTFGDAYARYMRRTKRFVPYLI